MESVRWSRQDLLQRNWRNLNTHLSAASPADCQHTWPVVAADGGGGQAGVAGAVDAVGVGFELGGAATAACVGDVAAQHLQNIIQRRGAVQDRLWCILGRRRVLEAEGGDLNSELHVAFFTPLSPFQELTPLHRYSSEVKHSGFSIMIKERHMMS